MTPTDDDAVDAFRDALRHATVAGDGYDAAEFAGFHQSLHAHFPRLFETCESVALPWDALLLRWSARTPTGAQPVVLMAHQDVVPIEPTDTWTHPPFDAVIDGDNLWGRGTLDDKGSLVAICVAVERLIDGGFAPARDVWLSFGADEEVMGEHAEAAVKALQERGVDPWFVIDEGGAVATGAFPGVKPPLAVIGVAEKGSADLRITASGGGGHASTPKSGGATAKLAKAILTLDRHPAPASLSAPAIEMLESVAQVAPQPLKTLLGNAARGKALLARLFARLGPETAAMVRTTTAVTMLSGSPARNVIATTATANVNMRVAVGETVQQAADRVQHTIGNNGVVDVLAGQDPSPVSPTDHPAYELIAAVTREVMPDAHPTPYVMNQATDARHFHRVWPNVYRFTPFRMTTAQRAGLHNVDEHITVSSWLEGITWYTRLIERL